MNGYYDYGLGTVDPDAEWQALGWPSKQAYHQAGRPGVPYSQFRAPALPTPTPPVAATTDAEWQALGWPTKQAYHQAGRPGVPYSQWLAFQQSNATGGGALVPSSGASTSGGSAGAASGGGLGSLLSGIPSTYLWIGGALVVFMMLKKR